VPHSSAVSGPCTLGETRLSPSGKPQPCDRALMAYDPVRDRVVVVQRYLDDTASAHSIKRGVIRIAQAAASAPSFRRTYAAAVTRRISNRLHPSSLTSYAGEITLALKGSRHGTPGLFVMTGSSPAHIGSLTRVPGTNARDMGSWAAPHAFLVAARRDRVVLARQRSSARWDKREQGIWLQERVRRRSTQHWQFRSAHHLTRSAYDVLSGLALGAGPAPIVGYTR